MPTSSKFDSVTVDDPNLFDRPVNIVLRRDLVVECYGMSNAGLEEYAGLLRSMKVTREQRASLVAGVKKLVCDRPFSQRSLFWLSALQNVGLLSEHEGD